MEHDTEGTIPVREGTESQLEANGRALIQEAHRSVRECVLDILAHDDGAREHVEACARMEIWLHVVWRLAGLEREKTLAAAFRWLTENGRIHQRILNGTEVLVVER